MLVVTSSAPLAPVVWAPDLPLGLFPPVSGPVSALWPASSFHILNTAARMFCLQDRPVCLLWFEGLNTTDTTTASTASLCQTSKQALTFQPGMHGRDSCQPGSQMCCYGGCLQHFQMLMIKKKDKNEKRWPMLVEITTVSWCETLHVWVVVVLGCLLHVCKHRLTSYWTSELLNRPHPETAHETVLHFPLSQLSHIALQSLRWDKIIQNYLPELSNNKKNNNNNNNNNSQWSK